MEYICLNNLVRRTKSGFSPIRARVYYPDSTDGAEWLCLIEVQGLEKSGKFRAYGADSLQAMQLGIRTLLDIICESPEQLRGDILIRDAEDGVEKLDAKSLFS